MPLQVEHQRAWEDAGVPLPGDVDAWVARCFPNQPDETVVIRVVGEDESARLNQTYRGKARATNVLSFPFEAPEGIPVDHLGDLVICAPVVAREAAQQHKPLPDHWAHMIIHGILHLLGHDHIDATRAGEMESIEVELLGALGIPDPYAPVL